jgi:hypothetical protein
MVDIFFWAVNKSMIESSSQHSKIGIQAKIGRKMYRFKEQELEKYIGGGNDS